jgi:hypothetical protein
MTAKIRLVKATTSEQELWDRSMAPNLTGDEATDRLVIQKWIEEYRFKPTVLYNGNGVVRKEKIVTEFKRILKRGTLHPMSDYFYSFLTLNAGSIAHYNKVGWIREYGNSAEQLCKFFLTNEFGSNIVSYQPHWKTDCIEIGKELLELSQRQIDRAA